MKSFNPNIFLEAAELIETDRQTYTCNAIELVGHHSVEAHSAVNFYQNLFDIGRGWSTFDNIHFDVFGEYASDAELKEIRLIALCLAYEITTCKKQKKAYRK